MSIPKTKSDMLVLARESRGITQNELARVIGIGQSVLSKYENGLLDVSGEQLREIASALQYPESLFMREDSIAGFGSTCIFYRKRQTLPVQILKKIQARMNLRRMEIERLLRSVEIEPVYEFPRMDIAEYDSAERIADLTRRAWQLPIGPIANLVAAIERAGGIVIPMQFGTRKLDAISQWTRDMIPLFFINTEMPGERIRFSLAHEIGHLIMHRNPPPNQEREADIFASAFLMPSRDVVVDLRGISLARALQLKPYWRVSMQALIRRAYDLSQISESQYRKLFTQISRLGYRINEPDPIRPDEVRTFRSLVDVHIEYHRYTLSEMSQLVDLYETEFKEQYLPQSLGPIRIVK